MTLSIPCHGLFTVYLIISFDMLISCCTLPHLSFSISIARGLICYAITGFLLSSLPFPASPLLPSLLFSSCSQFFVLLWTILSHAPSPVPTFIPTVFMTSSDPLSDITVHHIMYSYILLLTLCDLVWLSQAMWWHWLSRRICYYITNPFICCRPYVLFPLIQYFPSMFIIPCTGSHPYTAFLLKVLQLAQETSITSTRSPSQVHRFYRSCIMFLINVIECIPNLQYRSDFTLMCSYVRPNFLTRVDSQLYRVRTVTAESREIRRPRLML